MVRFREQHLGSMLKGAAICADWRYQSKGPGTTYACKDGRSEDVEIWTKGYSYVRLMIPQATRAPVSDSSSP